MTSQIPSKPRVYGEETEYGCAFIDSQSKARWPQKPQLQHIVKRVTINGDFIANGGRAYEDQNHIEYATPECICVSDVVRYSKAGEHILNKLAINVTDHIKQRSSGRVKDRLRFFRHNVDTHREQHLKNSAQRTFGCHENYSFDPQKLNRPNEEVHSSFATTSKAVWPISGQPILNLVRAQPLVVLYNHLLPFLISRFIWQGNGNLVYRDGKQQYQLSQRIPHMRALANMSTTINRGIFNWRNEPFSSTVGRLHIICGDANMSEFQTYLKFGATGIVMSMIEDGYSFDHLHFKNGVLALNALNEQMNLRERYPMAIGEPKSHLQIQREYLKQARAWAHSKCDLKCDLDDEITNIIQLWEETLTMLEDNDPVLERRLDWVAKRKLIFTRAEKRSCQAETLDQMNLQYHDVDPQKGLYYLLTQHDLMETFLPHQDVVNAVMRAPEGSRAKTRQAVIDYIKQYCSNGVQLEVTRVFWDIIHFNFKKKGITYQKHLELPTPYDTTDESINRLKQLLIKSHHR
ncbi:proteasome accessory factor PafA2 family protein [Candidatus Woesearchaeota archaeon]|nr:proteasome accessory factor PafA2 family protein [Candidatus Woesearchaeota archaeon]